MVLAVDSGLGDREDIVKEKVTEVGQFVAFPIVYPLLQRLDGCFVLCLTLGLIDPISDSLRG